MFRKLPKWNKAYRIKNLVPYHTTCITCFARQIDITQSIWPLMRGWFKIRNPGFWFWLRCLAARVLVAGVISGVTLYFAHHASGMYITLWSCCWCEILGRNWHYFCYHLPGSKRLFFSLLLFCASVSTPFLTLRRFSCGISYVPEICSAAAAIKHYVTSC